jgi:multidrug efflux system membrane fusion protein
MSSFKEFAWRSGGFLALIALWGCDSTPPVAETPPPAVSVSQPLAQAITDFDDYEGRIAPVETVEVRARVRGHIVKINFQDGQIVQQGQMLFEIDPRTYQAELDAAKAQLAAADGSLDLATKEYRRASSLLRSRAASQEEVDVWVGKQAVARGEQQKAQAEVERATLNLDFTKVEAPITGKASRALVTIGNLINDAGGETLLTTIVSVDPVYVYFDVDERSLLRYRKQFSKDKGESLPVSIKDLKIPIRVALEGESGFPHPGVIDFADNHVNPATGTIQVRGLVANPSRLFDAGMRARIRVPVSDPHKVLLVTERAVGTDQGRKFVYIVNGQNVVERRDVTLGRLNDGLQVVSEGVKPEDWVIVNGIQRVRDAAQVDPKRVTMPGAIETGKRDTKS